jgi:hypothetical protein
MEGNGHSMCNCAWGKVPRGNELVCLVSIIWGDAVCYNHDSARDMRDLSRKTGMACMACSSLTGVAAPPGAGTMEGWWGG